MKIAIYGGSFNPPHLGHLEAALTVSRTLQPDRLLIIPDNIPPHKDMAEDSPTPQQRLELCILNFASVPGAEISDIELRRSGKSYTSITVEELKGMYPGDELYLVVGTDMFLSFEQWHRFRFLLENCTIAVQARADGDTESIKDFAVHLKSEYGARVEILPHEPLEMSSSDICQRLRMGCGHDLLNEEVYTQIIRNRFYCAKPELTWLREKAYEMLSPKRIAHVAGCESEAVLLANLYAENAENAAEAGILHDITKKLSPEEQLLLCDKYGIICDNGEISCPQLLHAITGAAAARELFGISDEVYNAIRWHTTGKPDMTLLEKIIYMADYVEPTRDFPGVKKLRELAHENLDAAMALGLRMSIEDIRSRGTEPYKNTLDACRWYSGSD